MTERWGNKMKVKIEYLNPKGEELNEKECEERGIIWDYGRLNGITDSIVSIMGTPIYLLYKFCLPKNEERKDFTKWYEAKAIKGLGKVLQNKKIIDKGLEHWTIKE